MATSWLNEVRVATIGSNITLTGTGTPTMDGVSLTAGDRILVKDQTTASQNGVYVWASGGTTWSRSTDFAAGTASVTPEVAVRVSEGTVNAHSQWYLTTQGAVNVGTTSLSFSLIKAPSAWKDYVRAASSGANLALSGTQTVDGVSLTVGDRVLVKDQTTASQNGVYLVASGSWPRAVDAASSSLVTPETTIRVSEGATNAHTEWNLTTAAPITLGTTGLTFAKTQSSWKSAARLATVGANLPLSGLTALDGVTPVDGDRILVKDQTAAAQNGIYVAHSGAWTRAADAATTIEAEAVLRVSQGTLNAHTAWVLTTPGPINVGTSALSFARATPFREYDAKTYGAVADGSLGSSSVGTDSAPALRALLRAGAATTLPFRASIPAGTYVCRSPIFVPNVPVEVEGEAADGFETFSYNASILVFPGPASLDAIFGAVFQASHAYAEGTLARPTNTNANGFYYAVEGIPTGNSSTEPVWPTTLNATVSSGGVVFRCVGDTSMGSWIKLTHNESGGSLWKNLLIAVAANEATRVWTAGTLPPGVDVWVTPRAGVKRLGDVGKFFQDVGFHGVTYHTSAGTTLVTEPAWPGDWLPATRYIPGDEIYVCGIAEANGVPYRYVVDSVLPSTDLGISGITPAIGVGVEPYKGPAPQFVAGATYQVGQLVRPTDGKWNGFYFQVTVGGIAGTEPSSWPSVPNSTVTSGAVTFQCVDVIYPRSKGPLTSNGTVVWRLVDDTGIFHDTNGGQAIDWLVLPPTRLLTVQCMIRIENCRFENAHGKFLDLLGSSPNFIDGASGRRIFANNCADGFREVGSNASANHWEQLSVNGCQGVYVDAGTELGSSFIDGQCAANVPPGRIGLRAVLPSARNDFYGQYLEGSTPRSQLGVGVEVTGRKGEWFIDPNYVGVFGESSGTGTNSPRFFQSYVPGARFWQANTPTFLGERIRPNAVNGKWYLVTAASGVGGLPAVSGGTEPNFNQALTNGSPFTEANGGNSITYTCEDTDFSEIRIGNRDEVPSTALYAKFGDQAFPIAVIDNAPTDGWVGLAARGVASSAVVAVRPSDFATWMLLDNGTDAVPFFIGEGVALRRLRLRVGARPSTTTASVGDLCINVDPTSGNAVGFFVCTVHDAVNGDVWVDCGKVEPSWTPKQLTNLLAWFRADQGVSLDTTGKVSQWSDLSGNANHLTQATAAARPGRNVSDVNYNKRPSIQTATTTYLTNTSVVTNQPCAVIAVGHKLATDGNVFFGLSAFMYLDDSAGHPAIFAGGTTISDTASSIRNPGTIYANFNGASSKVGVGDWLSGGTAGNPGANNGTGFGFGAAPTGAFGSPCVAAEIIVLQGNAAPSAAEVASLASYFLQLYVLRTS